MVGGSSVGVASAHSPLAGTYSPDCFHIQGKLGEIVSNPVARDPANTGREQVRGGSGQWVKREWVGGKVQL